MFNPEFIAAGYQIDERLRRRNTDTSPAQRASGLDGDICLEGTSDQFTGGQALHFMHRRQLLHFCQILHASFA